MQSHGVKVQDTKDFLVLKGQGTEIEKAQIFETIIFSIKYPCKVCFFVSAFRFGCS